MPTQDTPPSSTSSNVPSPDTQAFRVVRKRNRIPLSCAPCRHRKLKCDRAHPCDNCTKRGDAVSCNYATPGNRKKSSANGAASGNPDDMQNRIDRLEGLVLSLMTTGNQPSSTAAAQAVVTSSRSDSLSTTSEARMESESSSGLLRQNTRDDAAQAAAAEDSEVEQVSKTLGIMKVDNGRAVYASDAHWYAILGEISEVKKYFESHKEDYARHMESVQAVKAHESPGTAFLLEAPPAKDKAELLAAFPSKANADRLIARYFNAYDPSVHIIHGPSFQKQYDRHWQATSETPATWLALCFAMMTLALQSYNRAGDEPPEYRGRSLELSHDFRRLTAQSLLLADITQPLPQILETLVLHVQAEYGRSRDAEPGVLLLTSLCVRLAMRMGYHRDPGPHPAISPFEGELRRRVWTFVRQCDLLISFQFGLPAMVRSDQCDTEPPRNLYDDELREDMTALPPSWPTFEATPMSYMISKRKMTFLFGRIVERTQSLTNPPSYDETMAFDQELREARTTHPPLLQMRPFQESARDPANLIMQRLSLEMVFLRSLFVLHRRFIARGRENPRYAPSRRTCIDASLQLLDHQATLHVESEPGGRLRNVKWYISSLTTHDFLLAAMLVCLDLYHSAEFDCRNNLRGFSPATPITGDIYAEDRRDQMLRAVEHCIEIWDSVRDSSMEAFKASISLRVMVKKLKTHQQQQQSLLQQQPQPPTNDRFREAIASRNQDSGGQSGTTHSFTGTRAPNYGLFPNGNVSDLSADDLPPEQSAAMTLGMLSSGGLSPGSNFTGGGVSPESRVPSSMAALLNDPVPEKNGLMPSFGSLADPGAMTNAPSPLTQMFNQAGFPATPMDGIGNDIDWGAWDSYIQGTTNTGMDPVNTMWPMNMDLSQADDWKANMGNGNIAGNNSHGGGSGGTYGEGDDSGAVGGM